MLAEPLAFVRPRNVAVVRPIGLASSVTAVGAPNIDVPSWTRRRMLSKFAIVFWSATERIAVSKSVLSSSWYVLPGVTFGMRSLSWPWKTLSESLRTSLNSSERVPPAVTLMSVHV